MAGTPSDNLYVSGLPDDFDQAQMQAVFGEYGQVSQCKYLDGKNSGFVRYATLEEAQWVQENLDGNIPQGMDTAVKVRYANPPGSKGDAGKGFGKAAANGGGKSQWGPYAGGDKGWGKGAGDKGWGKGMGDKGWGKGDKGCGKGDKGWGKDMGDKGWGKGMGGKGGGTVKVLKQGLLSSGVLPGGPGKGGRVPDDQQLFITGLPEDSSDVDLYEMFSPFGAIAPRGVRAMTNEQGQCKGIGFVDFIDPAAAQTAIMTLNGTMLPDGTVMKVKIKNTPKGKGGK